jgi:O-acetyl-ADP-ribose deacetylase (regulator of RNase III)
VITGGGNLAARYVIHTVGPIWNGGGRGEESLLRNAYNNSLSLAAENGLKSVSFPSISTGAYRYPIAAAAEIALRAVNEFLLQSGNVEEVRFVLFSDGDLAVYRGAAARIFTAAP